MVYLRLVSCFIYAPSFFAFRFYFGFHFQGVGSSCQEITNEATEASTFLKQLCLNFFPLHRYVLNTVRNRLVLEKFFSVYIT